ncbi:MAG: inorganic pyrophosphatase [Bacteroidia bacterium]
MSFQKEKSHPWHGISPGENAPELVTAFIEIVPSDTVKYEIDKQSGYLKVDRPQLFSNVLPALYGFVPQTYCGAGVAAMGGLTKGDGDPLDICVLSEHKLTHGDVLLRAIPIGGFRLVDKEEADDKIIAVLVNDAAYGAWRDLSDCPPALLARLRHYFLTYKSIPGIIASPCVIAAEYGAEMARKTIMQSIRDYQDFVKS